MRAPALVASRVLALLALVAAAVAARPRVAEACAPAAPPGVVVEVAEESAIIVWDAAKHHEDFIRRAWFHTTGRDFGFLVPTPDKPELAEVPDAVFDRLDAATRPEVVHQTQVGGVEVTSYFFGAFLTRSAQPIEVAALASVRVVAAQQVGGYDAVVLEADSAGALAAWLKEHGYAERAALSAWLAPYVAARWKITAFKIAAGGDAPAVRTTAVRMSFTTDRPFFPYREPADQRENFSSAYASRLLRVFFFGTERVAGTIGGASGASGGDAGAVGGDAGAVGAAGAAWPGRTIWSDHFDAAAAGALPLTLPGGAWLTLFEDRASPRPGTDDLFFAPAPDTRSVKPAPTVFLRQQKMPLPVDLMLGSLLLAVFVLRRLRRLFLKQQKKK